MQKEVEQEYIINFTLHYAERYYNMSVLGLFTFCFLKGINSKAHIIHDTRTDLSETYEHVYESVQHG